LYKENGHVSDYALQFQTILKCNKIVKKYEDIRSNHKLALGVYLLLQNKIKYKHFNSNLKEILEEEFTSNEQKRIKKLFFK